MLARRAWAAALAGIAISPLFLISDLGRPARFLNMLRMFKVTSPMSVGSWILGGSGASTALAAANAWTGWFPALGPRRPAGGRAVRPAALHLHGRADRQHRGAGLARGATGCSRSCSGQARR